MEAEGHYHDRLWAFARETVEPGRIVLLGSSHLAWFDTNGRHSVEEIAYSYERVVTGKRIFQLTANP